jgi:hypothetical protein
VITTRSVRLTSVSIESAEMPVPLGGVSGPRAAAALGLAFWGEIRIASVRPADCDGQI